VFSGLRLRLTLLYLLATIILIGVLGGGVYRALQNYFQQTTDLALAHKMLHEFQLLGAPVPPELQNVDLDWSAQRFSQYHSFLNGTPIAPGASDPPGNAAEAQENAIAYDGELAAIFVMSLSAEGRLLFNPGMSDIPIAPNTEALAVAMEQGKDLRTVTTADGTSIRLLTYRLTRSDGPAALQLGRTLGDQERVLWQVLLYLLLLGSLSMVVMGFGSWWLAGRSIIPARQAWERQQIFIANASHELRAPLTLLRASAEVARRTTSPDDEDTCELLDDVLHESDHMNCLVEDLLLLSRLDAGKIEVQRQPIVLAELLADTRRQVGRLAEEKQITLQVHETAGQVLGDPTHLRQVLLILLDNAIHHTATDGTITISTSENGQSVDICVSDTGSGIAAEHLPHIFERFYRPDSTRTQQRSGAGLGLSIAKALVEAQQGSITAESEPGQGTRMHVKLAGATE
jgi:signal transduction histidine kinase